MSPILSKSRLGLWQGYKYVRVTQSFECLDKCEYSSIMPQYVLICITNAEYG